MQVRSDCVGVIDVVGTGPESNGLGNKKAIGEKNDNPASGFENPGDFVENFQGIDEIIDTELTKHDIEICVEVGKDRIVSVIEIPDNVLGKNGIGCELLLVHTETRDALQMQSVRGGGGDMTGPAGAQVQDAVIFLESGFDVGGHDSHGVFVHVLREARSGVEDGVRGRVHPGEEGFVGERVFLVPCVGNHVGDFSDGWKGGCGCVRRLQIDRWEDGCDGGYAVAARGKPGVVSDRIRGIDFGGKAGIIFRVSSFMRQRKRYYLKEASRHGREEYHP